MDGFPTGEMLRIISFYWEASLSSPFDVCIFVPCLSVEEALEYSSAHFSLPFLINSKKKIENEGGNSAEINESKSHFSSLEKMRRVASSSLLVEKPHHHFFSFVPIFFRLPNPESGNRCRLAIMIGREASKQATVGIGKKQVCREGEGIYRLISSWASCQSRAAGGDSAWKRPDFRGKNMRYRGMLIRGKQWLR